jgi:hypothetical protein
MRNKMRIHLEAVFWQKELKSTRLHRTACMSSGCPIGGQSSNTDVSLINKTGPFCTFFPLGTLAAKTGS